VNRSRRAGTREIALICVAAVLLLAAGVTYWTLSGGERVPAARDEGIAMRCEACGHRFHLPLREAEQLLPVARGPRQMLESGGLTCPQCRQKRAFPDERAAE
jgi:DNA-directed RNA polymerase subunit RPC12/RpoP